MKQLAEVTEPAVLADFDERCKALATQDRLIIRNLELGWTYAVAARIGGISRVTLWRRCRDGAEFAALVKEARRRGAKRRDYLLCLRHPFRDRRPPLPAGLRGGPLPKPRHTYGRPPR
jgi:hypothetical protein